MQTISVAEGEEGNEVDQEVATTAAYALIGLEEDILYLTDLSRIVAESPIANFTDRIAWDSLDRLLQAYGLDVFINITALEEFLDEVEESLENPEATILELTNGLIDIEAIVKTITEAIPDLPTGIKQEAAYLPLLDISGPYSFFPSHCYPDGGDDDDEKDLETVTRYNSPIIAYISTGSDVE